MQALDPLFVGHDAMFIGSHPIAGSEQTGMESAHADLYDGAVVFVTPSNAAQLEHVKRLGAFWASVGGRAVTVDAGLHDRLIARTSHLPHLAAAMLVHCAGRDQEGLLRAFCGSGFRDTTRIAAGSPEMWHDIVASICDAIREELAGLRKQVDQCLKLVESKDFDGVSAYLSAARELRRRLVG